MGRVAVIGAGMGAMAAAARLAVAGHRVTVFERTDTYGGALRRRERDGFAFDTGPGLVPLPAVYRDLFVKTGKEPLEECVELVQTDPSARHLFPDGTRVDLPNASRAGVVASLEASLGKGAGQRWGDFLVRGREAWDRTRRPLLEEPLWPNWDVLAGREPYPSVPHRRLLRTRRAATLAQVGEWELGDPRLARLLESHALAYGLDPRAVPAGAAVLPYMEHAFGVWYVRGGLRELARAVHERCLARRVEFRFGAEAVRVVEEDGRAAGLELADGTVVGADHVVTGVRPGLVEAPRGPGAGGEVPPRPAGEAVPGRLTVLLALRGAREADAVHRTVVHSPDRDAELDFLAGAFGPSGGTAPVTPTVTVLRPDDPALRPDGDHESAVLTAPVPAGTGPREAERLAESVLTAAEAAVPGLRERLLWHEVRTPADTRRETGTEGVPAPALAGGGAALLHPGNAAPLPGLYRVGGWSHPGGGLPHAGMSGALVAGLVVEGPDFRGSQ
ncbi:NAD(P)/FAD-dependent oxidoreductase [Streptomyces sp. MJP52]|uniref:phytoene desaturase family protein n=1 Tax=Streptomyces sp. MJP52 TaxID=2940555 RepID=UPI002473E9AE|nr:NAD(P)/FAD-dependent oxidoreductase [Streptomyces sp. MJP52]MDH6227382.1 phytoene desaturase [Streptomyces sp. MJP52]